jgi:hypothetical protein
MAVLHTCDHGDCPAIALRHADVHGQDFHFCNHHWEELAPALAAYLDPQSPDPGDSHAPGTPPRIATALVQAGR